MILQMLPGVLFVFLMLFHPESPRWLVEQGRYGDAGHALAYIVRKDVDDEAVQLTLSAIQADFIGRRRLSLVAQLKKTAESRQIALRCIIPSLATFFQQWTGTNAVNYYAPLVFAQLGMSSTTSALLATGVYGVVKFCVTCLAITFLIDSAGRKRTLVFGGLVQAATMFWLTGYVGVHPEPTVVPATYVSILAVYVFGAAFTAGWGCSALPLGAEVAPGHLRGVVMAIAVGVTWLFTYVIAQATPAMLAHIGAGTYAVFGAASVLMALWVYVCIPETKGCALEDIQYLFQQDVIVRALEDSPGGRMFLCGRQAIPIGELKRREIQTGGINSEEKIGESTEKVDNPLVI